MIIELEFDVVVELRFFLSKLPATLLEALGQRKQDLYDATGPHHNYGSTGVCEVDAGGKRFVVFVRLGRPYTGEAGEEVYIVRVLHIIVNPVSGA